MGSPISLSGFNNIDFNLILNAIMEQERVPIFSLETDRTALEGQDFEYGILATTLADLQLAAEQLATSDGFGTRAIANSDPAAISASVASTTPIGTYDIVVSELARAQVTASTSTYSDSDTTIVASGGTLTIGGIAVTVSGDVTLEGLSDAINATADVGVTSSVISSAPGIYQLVLTGNNTGTASAFAITNGLTGGVGIAFAGNAVDASNAAATVNNIAITSATNTLDGAVAGSTITLLKKDPATTVTLTVTRDDQALKTRVDEFVAAYNNFIGYADAQFASASDGTATSIGRDGLLRGLRSSLRSSLSQALSVGGAYSYLAEVGIGNNVAGELTLDATLFDDALSTNFSDVESLFVGAGGADGAFSALGTLIAAYTDAGGLVPTAQERIDGQIAALDDRIGRLEEQLAIRRTSLQAEFIAADLAISQLNAQLDSLSSLGDQFRLF